MDRSYRRFRLPAGMTAALGELRARTAPLDPVAVAKADSAVVHFLDRTTYGYTEEELAMAQDAGIDQWLAWQLDPAAIDDGGLEEILSEFLPTLSMGYQDIFEAAREAENGFVAAIELITATVLRQLYSPRQLFEVMVEFWTNHFNVYLVDGPVQYFKTVDDRDHVRPHALGRFEDLLFANAVSPAMLYYLDNYSNTREGPNENYARELLELHTLGVDGGYGEHDVKEVARCFTGWTLDPRRPELFVFNPLTHDYGTKQVLGRTIAANRGMEDGRQVLSQLAGEPATYRYLAGKLARRFIADDPADEVVSRVAAAGRKGGGSIPKMLRALFASESFAASQGAKFKRPAEYVLSVVRRLGPDTQDDFLRVIFNQLQNLGQLPYFAAPPTGYPDQRSSWLATSPLLARWNFASAVAYGTLPATASYEEEREPPPMGRLIAVPIETMIGAARTPEAVTDVLIERVLHRAIPAAERQSLIQLAADGRATDAALGRNRAAERGRSVLAALLASDHFQNR